MSSNRSFKEYVTDRFEDELFAYKPLGFIIENQFFSEFTTRKFEHSERLDIDKFVLFITVEINDLPNTLIINSF